MKRIIGAVLLMALTSSSLLESKEKSKKTDNVIYVKKEVTKLSAKSRMIKKYGRSVNILRNESFTRYKNQRVESCRKVVIYIEECSIEDW